MTATPATLEAARVGQGYALFPNHTIQGRDVEQAYISADLLGTPTYVVLPKELWTPEMHKMRCPVVRLEKALYGHKNSGVYWSDYCKEQVAKADFIPWPSENFPSVYWHPEHRLMLIIYVDDMLLSGPKNHMAEAWSKLGENIKLAVPPGDKEDVYTFLGCTHTLREREVNNKKIRCHDTDTSHAMQKVLAKYEVAVYECTGQYRDCSMLKLRSWMMIPRYHSFADPLLMKISWSVQAAYTRYLFQRWRKTPTKLAHRERFKISYP